uniref:Uncharacterized protein n=1 Tax=Caenorhabditis japonica TaxID=281687 RepID=A0A8R1ER38_CAEJA
MVRRGSRTSGPAVNNTSTSSLSAPSNRWQRSRPHSANSGELKSGGVKSTDSTTSSPTASSLSTSSSPPLSKKLQGSGGKGGRSSSHWRESGGSGRGGGGGGGKSSNSFKDSKFSITNEDFPALPGARGNTQSHGTPNKNGKKGDPRQSNLNPASKLRELATTTDDSGHSSGSRGHSPPLQDTGKFEKKFQKPLHTDTAKRKTASPAKERPPRGSAASKPLRAIQSPLGSNGSTASPNKVRN